MTELPSRRNFLRTASLGAAVVGAAAVAPPSLASTAQAATSPGEVGGPAYDGAVTAYVRNHRTGEISVMAGEHEVTYHDRDLARRLARIAACGH